VRAKSIRRRCFGIDMIKVNPALPEPIRRSLALSWKEGIASEVTVWIIDYYLTAYGLFLGASPKQIGWLVALPLFFASFSQFFVTWLVRIIGSRRQFLFHVGLTQVAVLFPAAFLALMPSAHRITILIALIMVFRVGQSLTDTVWFSLMSEYLPAHERPGYFGARSRITGSAGVASLVLGGVVLYALPESIRSYGFFLLFFATAVARLISIFMLARMADVPLDHRPEHHFTFWMFIRQFRKSNFVKYVFFSAATMFSVQLAGPYFSVYLLKDLKIDYMTFMVIHFSSVIVRLISIPRWGRHADQVGNASILKLVTFLFPAIPLLWIFSSQLGYILVLQMFAGFLWAGYALCSTNFIYDSVSSGKRVRCLGYWTLICGMGNALGAFTGGFLAEHLPPLMGYSILMLFLVSTVVRVALNMLLAPRFKEVRQNIQVVSGWDLFLSMLKIRPILAEKGWMGRGEAARIGDEF